MASAAWSLQAAIYSALTGNAELAGLLGGAHIYDDVPRGASFPYITFGLTSERDWSTATETGSEHVVTLHVWSRAAGRSEVDGIFTVLRDALHDADLSLVGHRLVNLRQEFSDARREPDGETLHGIVRLRAVTEPAA
ncbi:MAG: DUF3168 domain-containing protein [Hyphomicrobiaceae bacterium]